MRFMKTNLRKNQTEPDKKIWINENLSIRGLKIQNNQYVDRITISGNHNVKISNSIFNALELNTNYNANVEISGVKFFNSGKSGFFSQNCTSVIMKDIRIKNCSSALNINFCEKVVISNIHVENCKDVGCDLYDVQNFEIKNTKIIKCQYGLSFVQSIGKIMNVVVNGCRSSGVILRNSQVCYDQFLCINNVESDVKMEDFMLDDPSVFIQGG